MSETDQLKPIKKALSALCAATGLPDGPSLAMQRHDPTWTAWKALIDAVYCAGHDHRHQHCQGGNGEG